MNKKAGLTGLFAVGIFVVVLVVFGSLNPNFNFVNDYVSRLGAKQQPNALGFNILGFLLVGLLLMAFGLAYGKILNDRLAGILLAGFGLGFAFTSIPFDLQSAESSISKAHTVSITLGLASWLFGLARISYNKSIKKSVRRTADVAAILLVSAIIGFFIGLWSMPVTHRLVFGVVFGWTTVTSIDLIKNKRKLKKQE